MSAMLVGMDVIDEFQRSLGGPFTGLLQQYGLLVMLGLALLVGLYFVRNSNDGADVSLNDDGDSGDGGGDGGD